jgi:hypothetical protein
MGMFGSAALVLWLFGRRCCAPCGRDVSLRVEQVQVYLKAETKADKMGNVIDDTTVQVYASASEQGVRQVESTVLVCRLVVGSRRTPGQLAPTTSSRI